MAKGASTLKKFAIGTLIAGTAGYLVGVLSAPRAGKQTRKELKHTADHGVSELESQLKDLHGELSKMVGQAKDGTAAKTAPKKLTGALDNAKYAKDKLHSVLTALHDGEATDGDLDKALEDARDALEHLKKFLKK